MFCKSPQIYEDVEMATKLPRNLNSAPCNQFRCLQTKQFYWASLIAQLGKNLPAMQETQVQSPGWETPLEKGMATHSSIFAWKIL